MKDFIKGLGSVCLGSVAGAALGAASFFAIEALMPQPADAAVVHLQCETFGSTGDPIPVKVTFSEDAGTATITNYNGSLQRYDNAIISSDFITMSSTTSGVVFSNQLNRVTGEIVRSVGSNVIASGTCTKAEPTQRAF